MKLTSTQITGLLAVIGFGGLVMARLIMPHDTDRLPSGVKLSDLPTLNTTAQLDPTLPPEKPLEVGSPDARDDLYCSGVVFAAELEAAAPSDPADSERRIEAYAALAEGGRAKLIAEKAAGDLNAVAIGNAWAEKARADFRANRLAMSLDQCLARPAAKAKPAPTSGAADLVHVGSQEARDDLYCSGLLYAAHVADTAIAADASVKQLTAILALAEAGTKKLVKEGAAIASADVSNTKPPSATTAAVANAQTGEAKADYDARRPRIRVDACMARAAGLVPH